MMKRLIWITAILAMVVLGCADKTKDEVSDKQNIVPIENDTIRISTFGELCRIGRSRDYPLFGHYELSNDIDASESRNMRGGFEPIGSRNNAFAGLFDGNSHVIKNLFIDRPNDNDVGLFSFIDYAEIRNLGIDADSVIGNRNVGGLAGDARRIAISNSYFRGTVRGVECVGGLVGGLCISDGYNTSYFSGCINITKSMPRRTKITDIENNKDLPPKLLKQWQKERKKDGRAGTKNMIRKYDKWKKSPSINAPPPQPSWLVEFDTMRCE